MPLKCPLLKKPCIEHQCAWYIQFAGTDPTSGASLNDWGCSMTWMPLLLVENANMQRQTGAAVESFRNEMVKANQATLHGDKIVKQLYGR